MNSIQPATLDQIEAAKSRIEGFAVRTPLIKLNVAEAPAEIYLKLENLQPTGAFKVRSLTNVLKSASAEELQYGVFTGSSGNSGVALAWVARHLGLKATVYAPDDAPTNKLDAIAGFGATVRSLPFDAWWDVVSTGSYPGEKGFFANAVNSAAAIAGNGTIGLEISDDLPDVDTVVVPFGGGGLSCGIASAIQLLNPGTKILAAESEAAMPLAAAFKAGKPIVVPRRSCFISGLGVESVLPDMWPLAQRLLDGAVASSLENVAAAIRLLFERNRIVAEGAGAVALAAALAGKAGVGKIVCVVSGGNLDNQHMIEILRGNVP